MHYIRTLAGDTLDEMLHPAFRKVQFDDEPAIITVSTRARQAWVMDPSLLPTPILDITAEDDAGGSRSKLFRDVTLAIQGLTPEKLAASRNWNKDMLHTPLRDEVYRMWTHVFWDVSRFLVEAADGTGHMHPPGEEIIAVEYPDAALQDRETIVLERVCEKPVLFAPTFVDRGIRVTVRVGEHAEADEAPDFVFDTTTPDQWEVFNERSVYWIKKGEKVAISIAGGDDTKRSGVAAVFVYCKMCEGPH